MNQSTEPREKRLEIKKYANRRYYDTTHSRHLSLEEIRDLVREGYDLRVVDGTTGADITAQVLTQIILELDTPKLDSLPIPLLTRLIRMNDQLVKDFIEKYFNQALHSFLDYQKQVEEQIRRTHGLPSSMPTLTEWTKAMLEPFAVAFRHGQSAGAPQPQRPAEGSESAGELAKLVRQLQNEVAGLKQASRKQKRAGKRPKK